MREHGTDSSDPALLNAQGPRDISCSIDGRGQYSGAWDCYLDPRRGMSPARGMEGYPEHAEDGNVYLASCFPPGNRNPYGLSHWTADAHGGQVDPNASQWGGYGVYVVIPPGEDLDFDEGGPGLLEVWVEALNSLEMHGPAISTAPPADSGLVRLPTWLWTEQTELTWPDTIDARAEGGPWVVEAWAEPQHIEWDMGDGREPQHCGPGVAWSPGDDASNPPADVCRHTYLRPSSTEPNGVFEVLAMTTWRVWWHVNGAFDNDVEIQVGTTATYQVNEVQVLTRS